MGLRSLLTWIGGPWRRRRQAGGTPTPAYGRAIMTLARVRMRAHRGQKKQTQASAAGSPFRRMGEDAYPLRLPALHSLNLTGQVWISPEIPDHGTDTPRNSPEFFVTGRDGRLPKLRRRPVIYRAV